MTSDKKRRSSLSFYIQANNWTILAFNLEEVVNLRRWRWRCSINWRECHSFVSQFVKSCSTILLLLGIVWSKQAQKQFKAWNHNALNKTSSRIGDQRGERSKKMKYHCYQWISFSDHLGNKDEQETEQLSSGQPFQQHASYIANALIPTNKEI